MDLGEASGAVDLPPDSRVRLDCNKTTTEDPSLLYRSGLESLVELSFDLDPNSATRSTDPAILGDQGLGYLRQLSGLQALYLPDHDITDRGIKFLGALQELRRLDLNGTQVGDEALEHLQLLPFLETLDLSRTRIAPPGFRRLG